MKIVTIDSSTRWTTIPLEPADVRVAHGVLSEAGRVFASRGHAVPGTSESS